MCNSNLNPLSSGIITIVIAIVMMLTTACNSSRKAARQLAHIQAMQPAAMAAACAAYYPATDSVYEKAVYKEGTPLLTRELKYVNVNCDNPIIKNARRYTLPCPPCDSLRVDTVYITRYERRVDRALQITQGQVISQQQALIAKQKVMLQWWMWIAIVCGSYTILRWLLRNWNIRLP